MLERPEVIKLISNTGEGRTWVLLRETDSYQGWIESLAESISQTQKVLQLEITAVTSENWQQITEKTWQLIEELGIRQFSIVAFGAASSIGQNLALTRPKLLRCMLFIDGASKPHPTRFSNLIDSIENVLPFGLPLRAASKAFDLRPYVHRLRTPTVFAVSSKSTQAERDESSRMANLAPTSGVFELFEADEASSSDSPQSQIERLATLTQELLEIPVKCPQRRLNSN